MIHLIVFVWHEWFELITNQANSLFLSLFEDDNDQTEHWSWKEVNDAISNGSLVAAVFVANEHNCRDRVKRTAPACNAAVDIEPKKHAAARGPACNFFQLIFH